MAPASIGSPILKGSSERNAVSSELCRFLSIIGVTTNRTCRDGSDGVSTSKPLRCSAWCRSMNFDLSEVLPGVSERDIGAAAVAVYIFTGIRRIPQIRR